jgi:ribonuclease HI
MKIEIYSDGSGNYLAGNGGWAYRIVIDGLVKHDKGGYLPYATNNVAELYAAVEGLKEVKTMLELQEFSNAECWLISDSKLVLGYADGTYKCKAAHLQQLYLTIRDLYCSLNLKTKWVKGHSGNVHNEACDKIAKSARNGTAS